MLSKYLRGKGYLEQYFSEFIKLVGIIKKKIIYSLYTEIPSGGGGKVSHSAPSSALKGGPFQDLSEIVH